MAQPASTTIRKEVCRRHGQLVRVLSSPDQGQPPGHLVDPSVVADAHGDPVAVLSERAMRMSA
eukprot:3495041-Alexandrium_andersonii.AAC.1